MPAEAPVVTTRLFGLVHHVDHHGVQSSGWGRRPVVLARVRIKGYGGKPWARANYCLQIGAVCLSWGPAGGVEEGRASIPDELVRWGKCWWSKNGYRAYAIDWTREVPDA